MAGKYFFGFRQKKFIAASTIGFGLLQSWLLERIFGGTGSVRAKSAFVSVRAVCDCGSSAALAGALRVHSFINNRGATSELAD